MIHGCQWYNFLWSLMVFNDIELLFFSICGTLRAWLGMVYFLGRISSFPMGAFCIPGIQSANAPFHVEDEFEAKQKELEGIVNPIMMKVYQAEIDVSWIWYGCGVWKRCDYNLIICNYTSIPAILCFLWPLRKVGTWWLAGVKIPTSF